MDLIIQVVTEYYLFVHYIFNVNVTHAIDCLKHIQGVGSR
jgi:hypothetical protein